MNDQEKEREIEQWLHSAISQYGSAEPREGLEGRVLANLRAEQDRLVRQRRWWWAVATVAAATVLVALLVGLQNRRPVVNHAGGKLPVKVHDAVERAPEIAYRPSVEKRMPKTVIAAPAPSRLIVAATIVEPKLEQFPSSREVPVAEEQLVQYLQTAPDAALLKPHRASEIAELHIDDLETKPLEIRRISGKPLN